MLDKYIKYTSVSKTNVAKNPTHYLDTLEVTSEIFKSKTHETLYNSTLQKHRTIAKLKLIIDVVSIKESKKYWKTFHCNNVKLVSQNGIKGSLCRKRWCACCNRIKTAEMINSYLPTLRKLEAEGDLYFITLTAPTCEERQLKSEIKKRYKIFVAIKDKLRKQGIKLNGLRKIEVTYNEKENKYHPHFHFIQEGYIESIILLDEWLLYFGRLTKEERASKKAQDIKPIKANGKDLVEIMKYATKDIVRDTISAKAYHNILKSLEGVRVFQSYGSLKKVKVEKESKEETLVNDFKKEGDIYVYNNSLIDYQNSKNELLIDTLNIKNKIEIYARIKEENKRQKDNYKNN